MNEDSSIEDKKWRIKDTDDKEFWIPILKQKTFNDFVKSKYQISSGNIVNDEGAEEFADIDLEDDE